MLHAIFPIRAEIDGKKGAVNTVAFSVVTAVTLLRSLAHILLPDGGAHSIATLIVLDGTPDPNAVIHFVFALWGLSQLLMGAMYLAVAVRYRNLIPLMWVFILAEYSGRIAIGRLLKPLGDEYFGGTAPGEVGNYVMVPLSIIMILYSIYEYRKYEKAKGPPSDA
jgi:hypothetical protein